MLKNKKTMRIFSLILAISMLLSFTPTVMAEETAEETESASFLPYVQNFDSKDDADLKNYFLSLNGNKVLDNAGNETTADSYWTDGGYINFSQLNINNYQLLYLKDFSSEVKNDSVIVWEARMKVSDGKNGGLDSDGKINNSFPFLNAATSSQNSYGLRVGAVNGYFGYTANSGGPSYTKTNYAVEQGVFYTFKIKYNVSKKTATFGISDGKTSYTSPEVTPQVTLDYSRMIVGASKYMFTSLIDYVKIYDESTLPKSVIKANDGVDTTAVKENDKFTVTLENAITEDELSASPVTISDSNVDMASSLSEDGKTITLTLSNLGSSRSYKITVPDLGLNAGTEISFTSAKADYVLYENYFDTNAEENFKDFEPYGDDGIKGSNSSYAITNTWWEEGGYLKISSGYVGLAVLNANISDKIADDAMVVYEARIKHYGGTHTDHASKTTVNYFNYPVFGAGTHAKGSGARIYATTLSTDAQPENAGLLFYTSNSQWNSYGTELDISNYPIYRGEWYTYKITWDKKNNKVKFSVSNDTQGTVQSSDWKSFYSTSFDPDYVLLNSYRYYMYSLVDYITIYDETKLPHATVSETDLNNLKDGSTFTINFEQRISESDLSKITVAGGAEIEKALSADGKTVTLTFSNVENLKSYTLKVEDIGMNLGFTETLKGADYDYMLYRNEFDSAEDIKNIQFTGNNNATGTALTASNWKSEGYLEAESGGGNSVFLTNLDFADKVDNDSVVVWESRIKYTGIDLGRGGFNADGGLNGGTQPLLGVASGEKSGGLRIYGKDGKFCWSASGGVSASSGAPSADYDLKSGEWYTFTIKYDKNANSAQFSVCNDKNNSYTTDWTKLSNVTLDYSYVMLSGYAYQWKTTVDYIHIYDETLIPVPTVSGADLMNLKSGDKLTINFPFAVTSEELSGKVKIGDNVQNCTLSEDGKTAEFTLSDIALRTKYTLTIDAVGKNPAATEQLRGGEESKYYYRAEFDGNDDTSKLYTQWSHKNYATLDTLKISDGVLTTNGINYRRPVVVFGKEFAGDTSLDNFATEAINVEDKENIVFETKFKFNGDNIYTDTTNFLTINRPSGSVAIGYGPKDENSEIGLMYASNAGTPNTYFIGKDDSIYKINADEWYTITVRMNFKTSRYKVTVSDTKGDVASSGEVEFMYHGKPSTIYGIGLPSGYDNNYADCIFDYIYLYDDDYGKTDVTYNKGTKDISLQGNVFVTGSETFSFEALQEVTNPQITAKTADGQSLNVSATANGKNVSFKITDSIPADTKVIVTIAKETLGSESDQTVSFRTKWNESAEFVMPDMFENKETLDVVFFGGSITDQNGWRKTVTDGLTGMFSGKKVNCYNESWGGTGSSTGWNRLNMNVKPHNPDVVFVEYAVNDSYATDAAKWMESIVRSMNSWDKKPVIIFVYTTVVDFNQNNFAVSEHTRVAEAYGVPYISVKDYVMSKYNEDSSFATDWDNKVYLGDGTHTAVDNDGFKLYGDYINALLKNHSDHYFKLPKANSEVTKVVADSKDEAMEYTQGEVLDNTSKTFTFSGDELMLLFNYGADMGSYTLVVDGETVETEKSTHKTGSGVSRTFVSYKGFGEGEHTATITANSLTVDEAVYTKVSLMGYFQLPKAKAVFTKPTIAIDGATVKATFNYTTEVSTDVTLILAAYKADGTLANIQFVPTTLSAGTTSSSTTMPDDSDYDSFKAFVWDGLGSMQAKCESGEFVKTTTSAE